MKGAPTRGSAGCCSSAMDGGTINPPKHGRAFANVGIYYSIHTMLQSRHIARTEQHSEPTIGFGRRAFSLQGTGRNGGVGVGVGVGSGGGVDARATIIAEEADEALVLRSRGPKGKKVMRGGSDQKHIYERTSMRQSWGGRVPCKGIDCG